MPVLSVNVSIQPMSSRSTATAIGARVATAVRLRGTRRDAPTAANNTYVKIAAVHPSVSISVSAISAKSAAAHLSVSISAKDMRVKIVVGLPSVSTGAALACVKIAVV